MTPPVTHGSARPRRSVPAALLAALALVLPLALVAAFLAAPSSALPPDRGTAPAQRAAKAPKVGLFPRETPSGAKLDPDRQSIEVGVRFKSKVAGKVVGAQVYKMASGERNTPRKATLWSPAGKRLASAKFARTARQGWLSVTFSKPVKVTAKTKYTISVFAPRGRYSSTEQGFAQKVTRGPLTAPAQRNGVYQYADSSTFPTRSYHASNYWVDVVFRAKAGSTPTPPPPRPRRLRRRGGPTRPTPASLPGSP